MRKHALITLSSSSNGLGVATLCERADPNTLPCWHLSGLEAVAWRACVKPLGAANSTLGVVLEVHYLRLDDGLIQDLAQVDQLTLRILNGVAAEHGVLDTCLRVLCLAVKILVQRHESIHGLIVMTRKLIDHVGENFLTHEVPFQHVLHVLHLLPQLRDLRVHLLDLLGVLTGELVYHLRAQMVGHLLESSAGHLCCPRSREGGQRSKEA
mmetsp:Transcript_48124/g.154123  ORF Transcript_48124/g.154123 Transcript_48124/m.154123 type:complete len:210 (+) Transcript_48124:238-867(+)